PTVFRPSPLESIEGEKVFVAMTSSTLIREKIKEYLEEKHKCEVVGFSNNLSNRELLRDELKVYEGKYSAILTELKAAAVDVVTRVGLEAGIRVVYFDNVPIEIGKRGKMEKDILDVSNEAVRLFREKEE
ncbi:MAG: 2,3-diphosphoglycerate synthetase, partial [Actinomycetia bacterium]|nr:2,3-diphosphoglycerate synthetase [Actinomycetes bacterium]